MTPFDFRPRTRILFGPNEFSRLGEIARELNATRCLVIADPGIVQAGYVQQAVRSLKARRMQVFEFHDFAPNPDVRMADAAGAFCAQSNPDLIVAVGGGSTLDLAKAANVVASCSGSIRDYWGYGNLNNKPLIPMFAVPTTAGTGSEAQSNAMIFDPESNAKMIVGDARLVYQLAVLDPRITLSQPDALTASSGFEAITHALEALHSAKSTPISECFAREAWRLMAQSFERVLKVPDDLDARGALLLAAHFAGLAVENSSLGVVNACAQPLIKEYKLSRGTAAALVLAHVLEWENADAAVIQRVRSLIALAGLAASLRDVSASEGTLPRLAEEAAANWSGRLGPRPFHQSAALEIYQAAW